jgi:hypothetical protein
MADIHLNSLDAIRREISHLIALPEDALIERARVAGVLRALASLIRRGNIPFEDWQRRCLVSAAAFFDRDQHRPCLRQVEAIFATRPSALISLMPVLPQGAAEEVLLQFARRSAAHAGFASPSRSDPNES